MKKIITFILTILVTGQLFSQDPEAFLQGSISYVTSQNIYVKFPSTENISVGDTLYLMDGENILPALLVENLSSISCVCRSLTGLELTAGQVMYARGPKNVYADEEEPPAQTVEVVPPPALGDSTGAPAEDQKPPQLISGRFAISSYTNFSNTPAANSQKMRYTASFNIRNISGTRLSAETYVSFVHDDRRWEEVKENVFNGLKIYSLALNYDFNENTRLLFGRKINPKLSSMGAIDGLQFETRFKSLSVGLVAGSRPDYRDYSFDPALFQAGAYIGHEYSRGKKNMQSSLAFIQQMNAGNTDRRFLYLQHISSIIKNLFFIGTAEVDLYKITDSVQSGDFKLSNLYISARYRVIKQLSFTLSYNSRRNIIYYETYKNIIDQLVNDETLQGYRLQVHATPVRNFSLGATAAYRYRDRDPDPTKNLYAYASYSQVPWLESSATASFTWLETGYVSGKIYSVGLSKDIIRGKLSGAVNYRYVDYTYYNAEYTLIQNMAEINLMWRIMRKLSCSIYYEGTFEKVNSFNRIYINLTQRL